MLNKLIQIHYVISSYFVKNKTSLNKKPIVIILIIPILLTSVMSTPILNSEKHFLDIYYELSYFIPINVFAFYIVDYSFILKFSI